MTSHELARRLLNERDLPVAVSVFRHVCLDGTHERIEIGLLDSYAGQHVVIGDSLASIHNGDNWKIAKVFVR